MVRIPKAALDRKSSSLSSARVILEACPPSAGDKTKAFAVLRQSFSVYNSFHAISVPDLQDSAEFGRDRERVTNGEFATWIKKMTEKPISLYKVCGSSSRAQFEKWLEEAHQIGCHDIFLVGPDSSSKQPPPSRLDIAAAAAIAKPRGFRCGPADALRRGSGPCSGTPGGSPDWRRSPSDRPVPAHPEQALMSPEQIAPHIFQNVLIDRVS